MLALQKGARNSLTAPEGETHLFTKLAALAMALDDEHPRRKQIEEIQAKIARKRSRIKHVSQHSQQSLWGKDGGYQPA